MTTCLQMLSQTADSLTTEHILFPTFRTEWFFKTKRDRQSIIDSNRNRRRTGMVTVLVNAADMSLTNAMGILTFSYFDLIPRQHLPPL